MVQQRILNAPGSSKFLFTCTNAVKEFLLEEGTDPKYGARHLKRAIEKHIVFPLANLVSTAQLKLGDFVHVGLNSEGRLTFVKDEDRRVTRISELYQSESTFSPLAVTAMGAAF
jgi:ATP-dependent Clp protease ATP-binding subunit ClpB